VYQSATAIREDEMVKLRTRPYDAAEFLKSEKDVKNYIHAAFEEGDPALVIRAFKDVAKSKGVSPVLRRLGMTRKALQAQVLPRGRPRLDIAATLVHALGLKFVISRK
jgi:probable addiction module antidote protein